MLFRSEGQQLLDERSHLGYLDSFGGTAQALSAYRAVYQDYLAVRREMEGLRMDEAEKSRRMDTLRYQIAELERAELRAGEEEPLLERRDLLRNAGRLIEAVEGATTPSPATRSGRAPPP